MEKIENRMTQNRAEYERCRAAIHSHPDQMRARVLAVLFERIGQKVTAQKIADAIGTTPMFGARGGEPCQVKHVMAKMTLGILQNRLYRMTDWRIVVDRKNETILLVSKEEAAGMKTYVYRFTNFEGHDPSRDIRVDAESRYLDEAYRRPNTDPKAGVPPAPRARSPKAKQQDKDPWRAVEGAMAALAAAIRELKAEFGA
jgi:hypothetical protein